jgi:hypothetical protein
MRDYEIIEGSMVTVLEALKKLQGSKSEFKIEGYSTRQAGFEVDYSVLVSWLMVV